jgi:cyclophilin family peptidyl-prolyl cis-trans isomerase
MNKLKNKAIFVSAIVLLTVLTACGNKPVESNQGAAASPTATPASTAKATGTPTASPKSYTKAPDMSIDASKTYQAEVKTSKGVFTIDLFAKDAPKTVNNFVFLSKDGFYNNVIFHRIIKNFMVQTGDPKGNGTGGPGYKFEDELKSPHKYELGTVAMANSGPNTNGSQFFICAVDDCGGLNKSPNYTIFGKLTKESMETITKIASTPVKAGGEGSTPSEKVTIDSIAIVEK